MQPKILYYVQGEEQEGPVEQSEFEGLVSEGTIEAGILVWQEGGANWQLCAEVAAPARATALMAPEPIPQKADGRHEVTVQGRGCSAIHVNSTSGNLVAR